MVAAVRAYEMDAVDLGQSLDVEDRDENDEEIRVEDAVRMDVERVEVVPYAYPSYLDQREQAGDRCCSTNHGEVATLLGSS